MKKIGSILLLFVMIGSYVHSVWWNVESIPQLSGYRNDYDIAMNSRGQVLAMIDHNMIATYSMGDASWQIYHLKSVGEEISINKIASSSEAPTSSFGKSSLSKMVCMNAAGQGMGLVILTEGVHEGRLACIRVRDHVLEGVDVLSKEKAVAPMIVQSSNGASMVVWINDDKNSSIYQHVMASFYDGDQWTHYGAISECRHEKLTYQQIGPQVGMNDFGDCIVMWKGQSASQGSALGVVMARYFDGIDKKWLSEEIVAEQPKNKKQLKLSCNARGDVIALWDNAQGIETGYFNLLEEMVASFGAKQKEKDVHRWKKALLAEGEDLSGAVIAMNEEFGCVAWLEGYQFIQSAYFNTNQSFSWTKSPQPLATSAAYHLSMINCDANNTMLLWIGEGENLDEKICYRTFNGPSASWDAQAMIALSGQSLIDHLRAISVVHPQLGGLLFYDFFKEQLYFGVLKEGQAPVKEEALEIKTTRPRGKLRQKKLDMVQRRLERQKQRGAN